MYSGYKDIAVERRGRALWITMDNPPLNPMTVEMHGALAEILRKINLDAETKVVVLTGAGTAFSAGGNIKEMREKHDEPGWHMQFLHAGAQIVHGLVDLEKPIVARINGHAMGLGATLALLCDITVASTKAKIADPHVRMGLVAGDGGAFIWPQLIGFARAREYLLTGRALSATEAAAIGLINHAVEPDALDAKVQEFVDWFENGPGTAISLTKKSINMLLKQHATALVEAHYGLEAQSIFSGDHREAVSAFLEGRDPRFE